MTIITRVLIARWLEHFRQSRLTPIGKAVSRKVRRLVRSLDIWWLLKKPVCWKLIQTRAKRVLSRVDHMISHFKSGSHDLSFQEWITLAFISRVDHMISYLEVIKRECKMKILTNCFAIA